MRYYDKYGNEILEGATVFYHGTEFKARTDEFGGMYLYEKWFHGGLSNRVVLALSHCKPSDLELWYPDNFDHYQ